MSNEKPLKSIKLDEEGIPILDEVVTEGTLKPEKDEEKSLEQKIEVTLQRLARSMAAEVAIEFSRELESRITEELAPLLEQHMDEMLAKRKIGSVEETPPEKEEGLLENHLKG